MKLRQTPLASLADANPILHLDGPEKGWLSFDCPFHEGCTRIEVPTFLVGEAGGDRGWIRNGDDLAAMTLTPSLKRGGRCQWHGFVKNGRFEHCGDSR